MPKPKLMLDTNVATKLPSSASGFNVVRLTAKIRSEYRVVVSPETLLELMRGVIDARDNDHLRKDQRRFRVMCGKATTADFMRFPVDFRYAPS
jgi:predicted nucleic acid-binding protein